MALTVKAYLRDTLGETNKEEIRRFSVDQDVSSNFTYLQQKLVQVFPALSHNRAFVTHWKDPEGEYVAFSTDEELVEALGHVKDGILRVYITGCIHDEGPVHCGVICDGCNVQIRGLRYKCTACHDYDLCRKCEQNGVHPDHEMLRITKPRRMGAFPTWMAYMKPGMHGSPSHCQKKWMRRCWKSAMDQTFGNAPQDKGTPSCPKESSNSKCAKSTCGKPECCKNTTDKRMDQDVGEAMADLLNPLGINSSGEKEKTTENADIKGSSKCKGKGKAKCPRDKGMACPDNGPCDADGQSCSGMRKRLRPWGPPFGAWAGKAPWMQPWMFGHFMGMEQNAHRHGQRSDKKVDQTTETPSTDTNDAAQKNTNDHDVETNQNMESDPQEWTILDAAVNNDEPFVPSEQVIDENMVDMTTEPVAPEQRDTRIHQALTHMKAMGFNDEGGWLTSLVQAKDGDINKVLDILRPANKQQ